jgi:sec-independent protein translocase protein TatA
MMLANILGPDAIIILVLVLVLIFGAGQLPKLARNIGEASKEFKKVQEDAKAEEAAKEAAGQQAVPPPPTPLPPAAPSSPDDKITLSKAELDALLAEREARARREAQAPPNN